MANFDQPFKVKDNEGREYTLWMSAPLVPDTPRGTPGVKMEPTTYFLESGEPVQEISSQTWRHPTTGAELKRA